MPTAINKKFTEMKSEPQISINKLKEPRKLPSMNLSRFVPSVKLSLLIIVILQIAILYVALNPLNILQQLSIVQVINDVSKLTPVPPTEIPSVVAVIGDGTNLPDVATIKNQNAYNGQVYKDAQNGDYVLSYTNKLIIYRKSTNKIIYNGESPIGLQNSQQTDLANAVSKAAEAKGIIPSTSTEAPQLSVITDVTKLSGSNAGFYKDAKQNDIVAIYPTAGKIIIYRSSDDSIINSGDYTFVVK